MCETPNTILIICAERLLREVFSHQVMATAPDLQIITAPSIHQVDLHSLPAGSLLACLDCGYSAAIADSIKRYLDIQPDGPVAVISTFRDPMCRQLMGLGINGYISMHMSSSALVHALRLLLAGGTLMSPVLVGFTAEDYKHADEASANLDAKPLTEREYAILSLLQQGKPNKVIGADLHLLESTVKTHLRSLMKRFNVHNRLELVIATRTIGTSHYRRGSSFVPPPGAGLDDELLASEDKKVNPKLLRAEAEAIPWREDHEGKPVHGRADHRDPA